MAKLWFEDAILEEWLVESLQFVYDNTNWQLRQALPVAQCIMWIFYLEKLCLESKERAGPNAITYPGSRYI